MRNDGYLWVGSMQKTENVYWKLWGEKVDSTDKIAACFKWVNYTVCLLYLNKDVIHLQRKKNHKNLLCDRLWGGCEETGKATTERVGGMWLPQGFSSVETRGWQAAFHTSSRLHDTPDPAPLSHRKSWRKTFSRPYFLLDSIRNSGNSERET